MILLLLGSLFGSTDCAGLDVDRKKLQVDDPGGMDEEEWAAHNFMEILKEQGVLGDGDGGRKALGAGLGGGDD